MPNGDGGDGGGLGGLLDALLAELAAVIQAIIQFLVDLVNALVVILNFLFAGEQAIYGFSFDSLKEVFQGLGKLLDRIFKQVVLAALKKLFDLYKRLQVWAKKLKAWLDRWHALVRKYQIQALRRIINLIQRARQILVIFRIFHFKFAAKLDRFFTHIESLITEHVLKLARKTNEIIFWIDFLVDPKGLFKLSPMAQSLYRYIRGLRGVLGIPESRPLTADEEAVQAQDRGLLKKGVQASDPAVQRILTSLDTEAKNYV